MSVSNYVNLERATSCEWPISEDDKGVKFCGCKNLKEGYSYCTEHHSMAYFVPDKDPIDTESTHEWDAQH